MNIYTFIIVSLKEVLKVFFHTSSVLEYFLNLRIKFQFLFKKIE